EIGDIARVQFTAHRIQRERHVGAEDSHYGMAELPAVALEFGIEDTDLGAATVVILQVFPAAERARVQIPEGTATQFIDGKIFVVLAREFSQRLRLRGGKMTFDFGNQLLDQSVLACVPFHITLLGWPMRR